MKKLLLILLVIIIFSTISTVSADENGTGDVIYDDNPIVYEDLKPLENERESVFIGEGFVKYPVNVIDENTSHSQSFDLCDVGYFNSTVDGNVSLFVNIHNSSSGKVYFSFLNGAGIDLVNSSVTYTLHNLLKGQYQYSFYYIGDKGNFTQENLFFRAYSYTSPIVSENITMLYKDGTKFKATLYDDLGNTVRNKSVYIQINGNYYTRFTDENGSVYLSLNLNPGQYEVISYFKGTYVRAGNLTTCTLTILPTLSADDLIKVYRNQSQFLVKAIDSNGNLLVNKTLLFNINGVFYNRTTNSSGIARLNINLNPGKYIITVENTEDGCLVSNYITVLPSIISNDLIKIYKNDSQYLVKIIDGDNNPISNLNVSMNINGVFYNRTTNSSGIAKLNINLNPGKYVITVVNNLDGCVISNIIDVTPYLFTKDLVKYYKNESKFVARYVDSEYNPVSNKEVIFSINGRDYTRVTDQDGYASLAINLGPGTYEIHTSCGDFKSKNTIKVLPTLFDDNARDVTIDYLWDEYKVLVLDGQGNPAKNASVLFNYADRDYTFLSDDDGYVTFVPIRINQMNKLTINYNGYTLYNNVYFRVYPYSPADIEGNILHRVGGIDSDIGVLT